MSKNETPLTRAYWKTIGGTLVEEFPVVKKGKNNSGRWIDAIIVLHSPTKIAHHSEVDITGKDIICIQTKTGRLGMYLMGQALFSKQLLEQFHQPKNVRSVALCQKTDKVMESLLVPYEIEVVVME